ncbi:MAG: hypothetical protein ACR2JS_01640 [Candidatus Nanopelagicales bacterium]
MNIDCGTCQAPAVACSDCVVSVLLGSISPAAFVPDEHADALGVLADSGLIPPLRLVPPALEKPSRTPRRRRLA